MSNFLNRNSQSSQRAKSSHDAFLLLVTLDFETVDDKQTFIDLFISMAEYVKQYESTTLSYEAAENDKNSKQIMIIERYIDKNSYLNIHKKSKEFIEFRQQLSTLNVKISGNSYVESNIGFM